MVLTIEGEERVGTSIHGDKYRPARSVMVEVVVLVVMKMMMMMMMVVMTMVLFGLAVVLPLLLLGVFVMVLILVVVVVLLQTSAVVFPPLLMAVVMVGVCHCVRGTEPGEALSLMVALDWRTSRESCSQRYRRDQASWSGYIGQ